MALHYLLLARSRKIIIPMPVIPATLPPVTPYVGWGHIFRLLAHSDNCTKFSHRVLGFTREERSPAAIRRAISVALRLVTSGLIASTFFFITSVPFTLETGSIIMILPFGGSFTDTSVCFFK
jgi:hypothetical protein